MKFPFFCRSVFDSMLFSVENIYIIYQNIFSSFTIHIILNIFAIEFGLFLINQGVQCTYRILNQCDINTTKVPWVVEIWYDFAQKKLFPCVRLSLVFVKKNFKTYMDTDLTSQNKFVKAKKYHGWLTLLLEGISF